MELGIIEVLLLKGGHLAVVDVCRCRDDGVSRKGVSYWVLAEEVQRCAVIHGYSRDDVALGRTSYVWIGEPLVALRQTSDHLAEEEGTCWRHEDRLLDEDGVERTACGLGDGG